MAEREVCLISDASGQGLGEERMSAQRPTPPTDNQWARALWAEGAGYMQKQQSALTVTLNLIISGLTSIILIVLSTINLQYQGQFVPNFLRQILRIVADYVMAIVWPSCSSLLPLCGSSSI